MKASAKNQKQKEKRLETLKEMTYNVTVNQRGGFQ
jgi:hypothetical protein